MEMEDQCAVMKSFVTSELAGLPGRGQVESKGWIQYK